MELKGQDPAGNREQIPVAATNAEKADGVPLSPVPAAEDHILSAASLPQIPIVNAAPEQKCAEEKCTPAAGALVQSNATQVDAAESAKVKKWSADQYFDPKPVTGLMKVMAVLNDWFMISGVPILRNIPILNRFFPARGLLNIEIDLPQEDLSRLRTLVNPKTAAFVALNHPEVGTDGIIDKKISSLTSIRMATFADKAIVNMHPLLQKFWLAHNVISNVPKGHGKEYATSCALKGDGVLLHPEGMVPWNGRRVFDIFPGIADMAVNTALAAQASEEHAGRPVYIAPVVIRYRFVGDISKQLGREMKEIEKRLGLPVRSDLAVQERFFEMQKNLLVKQETRFGVPEDLRAEPLSAANYFTRQDALFARIHADLEARYGKAKGSGHHNVFSMEKLVRAASGVDTATLNEDLASLKELRRNLEFRPEFYAQENITHEEMAESLKRIKRYMMNDTFLEKVSNWMPIAVGRRVAHLRLAEPIDVSGELAKAGQDSRELRAGIREQVRDNLQTRLDALNREIHPEQARYSRPNPFYSSPAGEQVH